MKKWTLVLGSFLLILSFQNCAQTGSSGGSSGSDDSSNRKASAEYKQSSASGFPVVQMWDYDSGRTLDVDVSTGHVAVYLEFGSTRDEDRCLSADQTQKLQNFLSQAQVCEPVLPSSQFTDQVCTMNYRAPYAVLVAGADTVRLGEQTSGCDVPTDLCGDQAAAFRQFVQTVLAGIDQQPCR